MRAPKIWPVPVSIITALAIYVGTYFAYVERKRLHEGGSVLPVLIGLVLFIVTMAVLTDQLLPEEKKNRTLVLIGVVAAETFAFFGIFMFLVLNTLGS